MRGSRHVLFASPLEECVAKASLPWTAVVSIATKRSHFVGGRCKNIESRFHCCSNWISLKISDSTMLMESKPVPAISKSEDSQENHGKGRENETHTDSNAVNGAPNDKPESREVTDETRHGMRNKPVMERDDSDPSIGGSKERGAASDGVTATTYDSSRAKVGEMRSGEDRMNKADIPDAAKSNAKDVKSYTNEIKDTTHHSLLPSPSSSFDHAIDSQQWSRSFNEGGVAAAVSADKHAAAKPNPRRSPTNTFPLPSPKSNRHYTGDYGDEEASFNLLNHSFDTISDFHDRGNLSPTTFGMHHHSRNASHISLPPLGQAYAGGDVSPMQSFGDPIPVHFPQDNEAVAHAYHDGSTGVVSNPVFVLRCAREAFSKCTFLLSCLKTSDPCPVNVSENGSFQHLQGSDNLAFNETYDARDLTIATRRVGAAICAFGGSIEPEEASKKTSSIFRPKGDSTKEHADSGQLVADQAYEQRLRERYSINSDAISWEVEENPPVEGADGNEARNSILAHMNTSTGSYTTRDGKQDAKRGNHDLNLNPYASVVEMSSNGTRMKYRCKLCGQPKQNHSCPYRQAMQRSLGVSVRPIVNSYTADEPGAITQPLSEMNNFVSYDSDHGSGEYFSSSSDGKGTHATVTPGVPRKGSVGDDSAGRERKDIVDEATNADGHDSRKRSHSEMEAEEVVVSHDASVPFAREVPLRPEQYRAVTMSKNPEPVGAFQYLTIPLTFAERQKLSDTLFVLSREIPDVTEECAVILREARTKDMWDLAVAELLTQLVVGLYCLEGDKCLDGLQNYLLYLGVSC